MPRTDDSAAFAANWRSVLAVDVGLGILASIGGVVLALLLTLVGGLLLIAAGAWYTALVSIRARRWARLRRQAGLEEPGEAGR
jgi:hypothetical protein